MGGCRCSYKNCTNTTKTRDNLHFFHYPVKQKDRCRQWIENANKPQFYDLDEDQLRNKVICETHFEDCYFPNMQKKRLLQGAIPTLEGDCEPKSSNERSIKIQDVQVLPANADGTIFVLETNMQNHFQSEKVESYIYTNNGLVLPINKCNESEEEAPQNMFSEREIEEIGGLKVRNASEPEMFTNVNNSSEAMVVDKEYDNYAGNTQHKLVSENVQNSHHDKIKVQKMAPTDVQSREFSAEMSDELFSRSLGNKYVKKINQHSRDIALLKRILKSRGSNKRPSNSVVLRTLRKQISPTLVSLVNLNLNGKCDFSDDDLEFFSTIYVTSPQVYDILSKKYNWKLPDPQLFTNSTINKNNGHVCCENN